MFHWQGNGGFFPLLLTKPQVDLPPLIVEIGRNGFLGVDIFFILSGFVIANSVRGRTPKEFLLARFMRLYPTYLVASLLVLVVIPFSIRTTPSQWTANLSSFLWLQFPFHQEYFLGAAWSLEFEIYFYVSVALMILLSRGAPLKRAANIRRALVVMPLLASIMYLGTQTRLCASGCNGLGPFSFFFSLGGFAPYFILGAMISRLGRVTFTFSNLAIFCVSGLMTLYSIFSRIGFSRLAESWIEIVLCVAAVLTLVLGQLIDIKVRPKLSWGLRWGGLLTYPIYLLHETFGLSLISIMVRAGFPSTMAYLAAGGLVLLASIVLVGIVDKGISKRFTNQISVSKAITSS